MTEVFVNELHYENYGRDYGEGVEIAGPAGTSLAGWSLVFYTGADGKAYLTKNLEGKIPNQSNGFGTLFFAVAGLKGKGNGLALVNNKRKVVQLLSYGVCFKAADGPAAGMNSDQLPLEEGTNTSWGLSLQLSGTGSVYEDFKWIGPIRNTYGAPNRGQTFQKSGGNNNNNNPTGMSSPAPTTHGHGPVVIPRSNPPPQNPNPTPQPQNPQPQPQHPTPQPQNPQPQPPQPQPQPQPQPPQPNPIPHTPSQPAPSKPKPTDVKVNLYLQENRQNHYTYKYHDTNLVILRRGFDFKITVTANGALERRDIVTRFILSNIRIDLPLAQYGRFPPIDKWVADIEDESDSAITYRVRIPANATPGTYQFSVWVEGEQAIDSPVTVLFNPWCEHDTVYMADDTWRNEYVLADDGFIWVGSEYNNSGRPWNFGQFNTKSLQTALALLKAIPLEERADPVRVSRHMSALVNSSDDNGVLVGNWSGDFSGGSAPTSWTGSAEILKQYIETRKPVKFGQCWVFSGLTTTVMRAIGIPARSVTNFASAHDTGSFQKPGDYNRAVDKYFQANGVDEDEQKTDDSIWNFHVWNDVWMARPDLNNPKYDGWQAIDATPQETSEGIYQTGPCPLSAIKDGEAVDFDMEFIYSEVNADIKNWVPNPDGTFKLVRTVTNGVGKIISTKAVGRNARDDVTLQYKYAEGSVAERAALDGENSQGDLSFSLNIEPVVMGEPLEATLTISRKQNSNSNSSEVTVNMLAQVTRYTGRTIHTVKELKQKVIVGSNPEKLVFFIDFEAYKTYLSEDRSIIVKAFAQVAQTGQTSHLTRQFDVNDPDLAVELVAPNPENFTVGSEGNGRVTFVNPFNFPLTGVSLTVEGQDLTKLQSFKIGTLPPKGTLTQEVKIKGWAPGSHLLIGSLTSKEVVPITGHAAVVVN